MWSLKKCNRKLLKTHQLIKFSRVGEPLNDLCVFVFLILKQKDEFGNYVLVTAGRLDHIFIPLFQNTVFGF